MKTWMAGMTLLACASAAPAQQIVSTSEPTAVAAVAGILGLKPALIEERGDNVLYSFEMEELPGVLVFGQCTDNRSCNYLMLVTTFNDLINPPSEWVSAHNMNLDLGKLWVNENGTLSYAVPVPTGGQDVPAAVMRFAFDQWAAVGRTIATSAIEQGLIQETIQPPLSNDSS